MVLTELCPVVAAQHAEFYFFAEDRSGPQLTLLANYGAEGQTAVGKRVRVPFGRGDRSTVGYCVGLGTTPPGRGVKEVVEVLDEESLLTEPLLRLTRWMADYYL